MSLSIPPLLPGSITPVGVTYRSTRAATWRCNLYAIFHNRYFLAVTGTCCLLISLKLPLAAVSSHSAINVIWQLAVAIVGMGLVNLITLTITIFKRLPTAKTVRICTTNLMPAGVCDITPGGERLLPWNRITIIREHAGDLYVWTGIGGIFVPREAFTDQAEAQRFCRLAVDLWMSGGTSWPAVSTKDWRKTG
jgi:hypothetical protein